MIYFAFNSCFKQLIFIIIFVYGVQQAVTSIQGPRIVWRLGWGVEYSVSKCAVRVENQVLNKAYKVENSI